MYEIVWKGMGMLDWFNGGWMTVTTSWSKEYFHGVSLLHLQCQGYSSSLGYSSHMFWFSGNRMYPDLLLVNIVVLNGNLKINHKKQKGIDKWTKLFRNFLGTGFLFVADESLCLPTLPLLFCSSKAERKTVVITLLDGNILHFFGRW